MVYDGNLKYGYLRFRIRKFMSRSSSKNPLRDVDSSSALMASVDTLDSC